MTKHEFRLLRDICKTAWRIVALSGSITKPTEMYDFSLGCPACEIEHCAGVSDCSYCPIERDLSVPDCLEGAFTDWVFTHTNELPETIENRKTIANKISKMKWVWRPAYKTVILKKSVYCLEHKLDSLKLKEKTLKRRTKKHGK